MRKSLPALFGVMATFLVGLAGAPHTARAQATAQVRVVHVATGVAAVDVLVDGQRVIPNLGFTAASAYTAWPAGRHNVVVTAANQPAQEVLRTDIDVTEGQQLTFALMGAPPAITSLVLTDDNTPPSAGQAKVRFVHGATDVPPINVDARGRSTLTSGLAFRTATSYQSVPAGSYTLDLRPTNQPDLTVATPLVNLTPGQIVTIFATRNGANGAPIAVSVPYAQPGQPAPAAAVAPAAANMPATGMGTADAGPGTLTWAAVAALALLVCGGWSARRHVEHARR